MSEGDLPAASRERHRISYVWLVPIIAIVAGSWLGYRALAERGTLIEITLQSAEGLEAGKTKMKHRDIELGTVEAITPSPDLSSVTVKARMNGYAKPHLVAGTHFWVVRPRLSLEGVSGLNALISGSYIEMDPGVGKPARHFVGFEDPPVISADVPGTSFALHTRRLGSIGAGAPVSYHGIKVGEVLGYQLSDSDGGATVRVFVRAPHDRLVHDGTRFWNSSGISVAVGSEGVKIQTESIEAILAGGVSFDVPLGGDAGPTAKPLSDFTLYDDENDARNAIFTRKVPFLLHLAGSAKGISPGATVRMHGIYVGEVMDVHMEYDAATKHMTVPVTFEVEPQRVTILHSDPSRAGFEDRSYAAFREFVARGLRARLTTGNILTGQKIVSLDFVPGAPKADMIEGGIFPEIPVVDSADFDSLMESTQGLLSSLRDTTSSLNQIVKSPEVRRSLASLDRSLANIDKLTHDASIQTGPLLANLRIASKSADETLRQATSTLAITADAFSNDPRSGGDLAGTLNELKQAARSLRVLTDYLESHPESLIQGKSAGAGR
ncbi:MAG TPA: MlaD family protein [Rhizomicrobium sp.]|jgi:paraquat-inducible protein B